VVQCRLNASTVIGMLHNMSIVRLLTSEDCGFWPVISLPSATTCSDQSSPCNARHAGRLHAVV
jgi:hypothetical protein